LEDRSTPSCSGSNFYGEYASASAPEQVGLENSTLALLYVQAGDPAGWGEVNADFGQFHGC
jgi:hypothetical protein